MVRHSDLVSLGHGYGTLVVGGLVTGHVTDDQGSILQLEVVAEVVELDGILEDQGAVLLPHRYQIFYNFIRHYLNKLV